MTKADALKVSTRRETVVLKVYIHCEECQKQVKKALRKLDGVESIAIDAELGKVTVVGSVTASTLVKKLTRRGKYATLWSAAATYNSRHTNGAHESIYDETRSANCSSNDKYRHFKNSGSALDQSSPCTSASHVNNSFPRKFAGVSYDHSSCTMQDQLDAAGEGDSDLAHHDLHMNQCSDLLVNHDVNSYMNYEGSKKGTGTMKGGKKVSFQGGSAGAGHATGPMHMMKSHASRFAMGSTTTADPYFHATKTLLVGKTLTASMDSVEYATTMFSDENAHSCSIM